MPACRWLNGFRNWSPSNPSGPDKKGRPGLASLFLFFDLAVAAEQFSVLGDQSFDGAQTRVQTSGGFHYRLGGYFVVGAREPMLEEIQGLIFCFLLFTCAHRRPLSRPQRICCDPTIIDLAEKKLKVQTYYSSSKNSFHMRWTRMRADVMPVPCSKRSLRPSPTSSRSSGWNSNSSRKQP